MTDVDKLVNRYQLVSDQVSPAEVKIVLSQLQLVLADNLSGDVVEFGCYKGTTSLFMMRLLVEDKSDKSLWLYDSFAGLPDKTAEDGTLGQEFQAGKLLATKSEVLRNFAHANLPRPKVKKAWFSDVADNDLPDKICFAYFDGDYYASIRDSFAATENKFVPGTIIVIDDYDNDRLPGARRAVDEWARRNRTKVQSIRTQNSLAIIRLCYNSSN